MGQATRLRHVTLVVQVARFLACASCRLTEACVFVGPYEEVKYGTWVGQTTRLEHVPWVGQKTRSRVSASGRLIEH